MYQEKVSTQSDKFYGDDNAISYLGSMFEVYANIYHVQLHLQRYFL